MARTDTPLYPPIVLREALANVFWHRDYSIGGAVTVCFKSTPRQLTKLTDRQKDILKILKTAKDGLVLREIHEKLPEFSDRQIRKDLGTLQTLGLAYSYGYGHGAN